MYLTGKSYQALEVTKELNCVTEFIKEAEVKAKINRFFVHFLRIDMLRNFLSLFNYSSEMGTGIRR